MIENLEHAVVKRNGDQTIMLSRRAALFGATVALTTSVIPQATAEEQLPTREEMEDYFLFLWAEHRRVAEELGIDVFDHLTLRSRGGRARYEEVCSEPASTRALRVLAQTGLAA